MSSLPKTVADGRRSGKAPQKSNLTQTCNLLSQFLKEKRSSGVAGKNDPKVTAATTKDLSGNLQNSDDGLRLNASFMEFLPQFVENPCIKRVNVRSDNPQLTIFYAGKMLVFDDFPPEKATEIMELATKLGSDNSSKEESSPRSPVTATENLNMVKEPETNTALETPQKPGPQAVSSDMRYPRRASLLKFLEKRKERVFARGPYQVNNPNPKHNGRSNSGGEPEDQCSKQFDLNL